MKEEIIFRLPKISLKEITDSPYNEPIAFNDVHPMNVITKDVSETTTYKQKQQYTIQRDHILIEKNVKDIMIQYQYCNQTHEWPTATKYHCFWCCHSFKTMPCFIPMSMTKGVYKVYGNFCSFNCALSFNFHSGNVNYGERSGLIQDLYFRIYGYDAPKLSYAPNKEVLEMFGGCISIEDYRKSFVTLGDWKLTLPNIVFIIPQLIEEKHTDVIKKPVEIPIHQISTPISKINKMQSLVTTMGIRKST